MGIKKSSYNWRESCDPLQTTAHQCSIGFLTRLNSHPRSLKTGAASAQTRKSRIRINVLLIFFIRSAHMGARLKLRATRGLGQSAFKIVMALTQKSYIRFPLLAYARSGRTAYGKFYFNKEFL